MPFNKIVVEDLFEIKNFYSKKELILNKELFFRKNGFAKNLTKTELKNEKLYKLISSLIYYTKFLKENDILTKLRFYLLENNIYNYFKCKNCENIVTKINKNKLNILCSNKCRMAYASSCISKDAMYKRAKKAAITLKKNGDTRWDTRRKNGTDVFTKEHRLKISEYRKTLIGEKSPLFGRKHSEKAKQRMRISGQKEKTKIKRQITCLKRYGVKNPGLLGGYWSKAAIIYIKKYIKDNNINEKLCYYKGGGINNGEYFISYYNEKLKRSAIFKYDFVVFKNENLKEIDLILEYNGPWHYNRNDILINPDFPGTPFNKNISKYDLYLKDKLKLNIAYKKCKNIFIFWEKNKTIIKYEGDY